MITEQTVVVWTLRNREDGRVVYVTRTVTDPAPEDRDWQIDEVDYINVEGEE